MDTMPEKAIYGAGFIDWIDILCISLKAKNVYKLNSLRPVA